MFFQRVTRQLGLQKWCKDARYFFVFEQVKTLCLWFASRINDVPLQNQLNFGQSVSLLATFYNLQSLALWVIFRMSSRPFCHQTSTFSQVMNRFYRVCVCSSLSHVSLAYFIAGASRNFCSVCWESFSKTLSQKKSTKFCQRGFRLFYIPLKTGLWIGWFLSKVFDLTG